MSLIAAIPYDLFTFGPFRIPLVSDLVESALNIPSFEIHSFGLFVAIGLLTTFTLASRRGEKKLGIDGEEVQNFGLYLIAIGWFFAHFFNVLFYEPHKVLEDPLELFKFWGSISSYGGLFGGIIAAWVWRWRNPGKDFLLWCDLAAWGLTFAWMWGRIGCASVHDHPGAETDFFLAISGWPDGATRHDLGFYEALWWVVICALMLYLDRKPRPKGYYLALVPTLYAPARFMLDFLRVGPEDGGDLRYLPDLLPGGGWTFAHFSSLAIFAIGLYFWSRIRNAEPIEWTEFAPPTTEGKSQLSAKERAKIKGRRPVVEDEPPASDVAKDEPDADDTDDADDTEAPAEDTPGDSKPQSGDRKYKKRKKK